MPYRKKAEKGKKGKKQKRREWYIRIPTRHGGRVTEEQFLCRAGFRNPLHAIRQDAPGFARGVLDALLERLGEKAEIADDAAEETGSWSPL